MEELLIDSKLFLDNLMSFKVSTPLYSLENPNDLQANEEYVKNKFSYIASIFNSNPELVFATDSSGRCGLEVLLKIGFLDNVNSASEASDFLNKAYLLNPNFNFMSFLLNLDRKTILGSDVEKIFIADCSKVFEELPPSWIVRKDFDTLVLDVVELALKTNSPTDVFYKFMKSLKIQHKDWSINPHVIKSDVVGVDLIPYFFEFENVLDLKFSDNVNVKEHIFKLCLRLPDESKTKQNFKSFLNDVESSDFDFLSNVSLMATPNYQGSLQSFFKNNIDLQRKTPSGRSFLEILANRSSVEFRSYLYSIHIKKNRTKDESDFIRLATLPSIYSGLTPVDIVAHKLINMKAASKAHLALLSYASPVYNVFNLFAKFPDAISYLSNILKDPKLCNFKASDFNQKLSKYSLNQISYLLLEENKSNYSSNKPNWEIIKESNTLLKNEQPEFYNKLMLLKNSLANNENLLNDNDVFLSEFDVYLNKIFAKDEINSFYKNYKNFSINIKTSVENVVDFLTINSPFFKKVLYSKPASIDFLNEISIFISKCQGWNKTIRNVPLCFHIQNLYLSQYSPKYGMFKEIDEIVSINNVIPKTHKKVIELEKSGHLISTMKNAYYLMALEFSSKKWFNKDSNVFKEIIDISCLFSDNFKLDFLNKAFDNIDFNDFSPPYLFPSFKVPPEIYKKLIEKGMDYNALMEDGVSLKSLILSTNNIELIKLVSDNNNEIFKDLLDVIVEPKEPIADIKFKYGQILRKYPDYLSFKDSNGLNVLMYLSILCPKILIQEWSLIKDDKKLKVDFINSLNQKDNVGRPLYYYLKNNSSSILDSIYSKIPIEKSYYSSKQIDEMKLLGISIDKNSSLYSNIFSPVEIPDVFSSEENLQKISSIILNEILYASEKVGVISNRVATLNEIFQYPKPIQGALFLLATHNFLQDFYQSYKDTKQKLIFERISNELLNFYSSSDFKSNKDPLFIYVFDKIHQGLLEFTQKNPINSWVYSENSSVVLFVGSFFTKLIKEVYVEKGLVNHKTSDLTKAKLRF